MNVNINKIRLKSNKQIFHNINTIFEISSKFLMLSIFSISLTNF